MVTNANKWGERLGRRSDLFGLHFVEVLPVHDDNDDNDGDHTIIE